MWKNLNSKTIFIGISIIYIISFFGFRMWEEGAKGGDPLGYYLYLPSVIIHQDLLDLEKTRVALNSRFQESLLPSYFSDTNIVQLSDQGREVIKYTSGMAFMILPFFLVAHLLSFVFGLPANGFSDIYVFFHYFSGLFYACMGLWLLRHILLKWFTDQLVMIGLIILGLGTNLFFFSVYHPVMAHAPLFFLHVVTIYATIKIYELPQWKNALILGVALGLITLIRPNEIIVLFVPLLWCIQSLAWTEISERFRLLKRQLWPWGLVLAMMIVMALPQLWYWRMTTGKWLHYSYGSEGFDFTDPHLIEGIFSYKNGWLAYTPIMIFAVIGLFMIKKSHPAKWPVWIFFSLHIYIIYSWWCWYYINGFGSRPMVEAYALLSIPLLYTWKKISQRRWLFIGSVFIAFLFIVQNLFNTWQYHKGLMWSEYGTKEYYFSMIGKTAMDEEDLILYDCGEYQERLDQYVLERTLYENDFEEMEDPRIVSNRDASGKVLRLDQSQNRFQILRRSAQGMQLEKGDYIQVFFRAKKDDGMARIYESACVAIRYETDQGRGLKTRRIRLNNKINNPTNNLWGGWKGGVWDTIIFRSKAPKMNEGSRLVIYFENLYSDPISIDDLQVELWKKVKN